MKHVTYRFIRSVPWVIALIVTVGAWEWHQLSKTRVQPFESWVLDRRVAAAIKKEPATKDIGVVMLSDKSMETLKERDWPWPLPRFVYGIVLDELMAQGASAVAFDMSFEFSGPAAHDKNMHQMLGSRSSGVQTSDQFFAEALKRSGKTIFGVRDFRERGSPSPLPMLSEAAQSLGHMRGHADADDVFRHVEPYLVRPDGTRIWLLGIQATATKLGLNLAGVREEPASWWHGRRLLIPKADGGVLTIPLDETGQLLVHWSIPFESRDLPQPPTVPLANVLLAGIKRPTSGEKVGTVWEDRIVFVGSTGELAAIDKANTPYRASVSGCSIHMNVAASLLSGRFNWTLPDAGMLLMLGSIAVFATYVTWHLRVEWATLSVLLLVVCYAYFTNLAYEKWLLILPILSPIIGAAGASYLSVLGFRMIVERGHAGRVKNLFGRLVAPDVIEILMEQRTLPWDTTQRPVTVLFADIRGFTAYTDQQDIEATRKIAELHLSGHAAIACRNRYAAESLETVNLYLATIVDAVKKHGGTLDKYIGDCVMAFWGAPVADAKHAARAVRAAMEAQRAVHALNAQRVKTNEQFSANSQGGEAGESEVTPSPLPVLTLGIAIHTGEMIVGFMGSEHHLSNYTVFGRNVNIASRIEKFADGGSIVTTRSTFEAVEKCDAALAENFVPRDNVDVKGINETLALYEVQA